jgi:hypothetical protein
LARPSIAARQPKTIDAQDGLDGDAVERTLGRDEPCRRPLEERSGDHDGLDLAEVEAPLAVEGEEPRVAIDERLDGPDGSVEALTLDDPSPIRIQKRLGIAGNQAEHLRRSARTLVDEHGSYGDRREKRDDDSPCEQARPPSGGGWSRDRIRRRGTLRVHCSCFP